MILLSLLGAALFVVVVVDVVSTTTGAGAISGSGPVTSRAARRIWIAALRLHQRWPSHRRLHVLGLVLTHLLITVWIMALWLAWTLVFLSDEGSVVDGTTGEPVDLVGKAYFAGYSLLTLGNGELIPGSSFWQLATIAAAGTGLGIVTLGVTYVLNIVQAGNRRRALANTVWSLGDDADAIVQRAHDDPTHLGQQLWSLVDRFSSVREQHTAFPVLHYLHAVDIHRSLPAQAAKLREAVDRLVAEREALGVSPSILASLERELQEYSITVSAFGPPSADGDDDVPTPAELLATSGWFHEAGPGEVDGVHQRRDEDSADVTDDEVSRDDAEAATG